MFDVRHIERPGNIDLTIKHPLLPIHINDRFRTLRWLGKWWFQGRHERLTDLFPAHDDRSFLFSFRSR